MNQSMNKHKAITKIKQSNTVNLNIFFLYIKLQSRTKYIGILLGFDNENLDLKKKINTGFWLFSTR